MQFGEIIYSSQTNTSYKILQPLKGGGQAEAAYASSNKSPKVFFIKRLLNIKYSEKDGLRERCRIFERERQDVYKKLNTYTLPGGTCSYVYDFFREKTFYYVVTEMVNGIPLDTNILYQSLSIDARLRLFKRIAYSFLPFEKGNIIHGDVKPENFLIKNIEDNLTIRLVDFESSFFISAPPPKGYIVGTEPYYSPELASYNNDNNDISKDVLTTKSDIFSLGVILYELLTGIYPVNMDLKQYCYEIVSQNGEIETPGNWSTELKTLVLKMLSFSPQMRPGIMDIVDTLKTITDTSTVYCELLPVKFIVTRTSFNQARVSIFCYNTNAIVCYIVDHEEKHVYEEPFTIFDDDVEVVTEVSVKHGGETITKTFKEILSINTNRTQRVSRPIIEVNSDMASIYCETKGAKIYYTTDGSTPSKFSNEYVGSFPVGEKVSIKAFARCFGMIPSDIVSKNSSSKVRIS